MKIIFVCCILWSMVGIGLANKTVAQPVAKNCPENETYFPCGANCQTECATLGQPCLVRYFKCPDGCYCNEGFARNADKVCIPKDEC